MKKLFVGFLILALVVAASLLFAAANGTNYNTTTGYRVTPSYVLYNGSFTTVATDSVGTFYSKAMLIGGLTTHDAYFDMVCSNSARGTEDVDVYVYYSYDRSTWFLGSLASGKIKDQLTTTAVRDTLNKVTGVADPNYNLATYMRLKFSCQAGNPVGTTISWYVKFYRDPLWPTNVLVAGVENSIE